MAKRETAQAYQQLRGSLQPPLMVVLDGGTNAYSAIRQLWPRTTIQRCLVHAQRSVRRYVSPSGHLPRRARQSIHLPSPSPKSILSTKQHNGHLSCSNSMTSIGSGWMKRPSTSTPANENLPIPASDEPSTGCHIYRASNGFSRSYNRQHPQPIPTTRGRLQQTT